MPELAIEIRGAEKRYPGFALGPLDLALEKGYVLGLIGPNGAGKTTTLRLLMGLAAPDAGEIRVLGGDPRRAGKGLRSRIGFVYDESRWYGRLSAGENAAWASRLYDNWDDIGFRRRLGTFGVAADKALDELSKGQRMKFALAVALSHGAELVVMDEPTGGLDPVSRSELLDALREAVAGSATSILFSTHITTDLERMADYVAFMKGGRLVFCEELDEVLERYALVKGPAGALDAGLAPFLVGRRVYEGGFEGLTDRAGELMARGQGRLLVERASLEDIMIYSVREDYNVRAGV